MDPFIEDTEVFGKDQWVYCRAHLRPHTTGWCSVGCQDKIGLGISGKGLDKMKEAIAKCHSWGLKIYKE